MSTHMKCHHPLLLLGSPVGNKQKANMLACISQYTRIKIWTQNTSMHTSTFFLYWYTALLLVSLQKDKPSCRPQFLSCIIISLSDLQFPQTSTHLITQQTVRHLVLFLFSESSASGLGVCGGCVGHHGAAGGQGVDVGGRGAGEDQGGWNRVQHWSTADHLLSTTNTSFLTKSVHCLHSAATHSYNWMCTPPQHTQQSVFKLKSHAPWCS